MLDKIKEAKINGEILSGIQIDYDTVITINPSKAIIDFYSGTKTTIEDNYISCLTLNDNSDEKSTTIKYTENFEPDCIFEGHSIKDIVESAMFCINYYSKFNYCINKYGDYDVECTIDNIYNFKNNDIKMHEQTDVFVLPTKLNCERGEQYELSIVNMCKAYLQDGEEV